MKRTIRNLIPVIICLLACACVGNGPGTIESVPVETINTRATTESDSDDSKQTDIQDTVEALQPYYQECDEASATAVSEFLNTFFEALDFGGFDQGHTDNAWYWAAQSLYQQGISLQTAEEGIYTVGTETARQWILQYFVIPEGSEARLPGTMTKVNADHPIAMSDGKLLFYASDENEKVDFHFQTVGRHGDEYLAAGEITKRNDPQRSERLFTVRLTEEEDGRFRIQSINMDGFSTPYQETALSPADSEFSVQATEIWGKVQDAKRQGNETAELSSDVIGEINEALAAFFEAPRLGAFNQENAYFAAMYSAQKMLRTDLGLLTYHESADYYTIELQEFETWMRERFVVPVNLGKQIKKLQNDQMLRLEAGKLVFRYAEGSETEPFCIDGVTNTEDALLVYGHNPDSSEVKQTESDVLGAYHPYFEVAVVLERSDCGRFLLREFYIR